MKHSISAIVVTKNEESRIGACLEHLSWVNEMIVADNGSADKTVALAKQHGAKVINAAGKDFSAIRESGLKEATGTWVLYVDADEEVSPELQKEIKRAIEISQPVTYFIKRDTYYLGCHWPYKDKVERLFLKSALLGWRGILHETPFYVGSAGILTNPLIHRTHRTLEEMVAKTNEWSGLEAKLRFDARHPPIVGWRLIRVMMTGFWRSFITQNGWCAGTVGWIESIYQAFSMFITYAKLWEMQQKKNVK
jgi:glycosyltransferase involved in cell wall biosynthesis